MDLSQYSNQQLKACLHALKDKSSGNKKELVLRLQAHDEQDVRTILADLSDPQANVTSVNLLDASLAGEGGEDPVAQLKGEMATLTQTVTALVQQMQNVLTGPRGGLMLPPIGVEQSHMAQPLSPVCEGAVNVAAQPSGALLPNQCRINDEGSRVTAMPVMLVNSVTANASEQVPPPASHSNLQAQGGTNDTTQVVNNYNGSGRASRGHYSDVASHVDVRDIIRIMPDFCPGTGLSSTMFINRINQLSRAYDWNEQMLLYALYDKLKGAARQWISAMPIFRSWDEFVEAFLADFPCEDNTAELNMKMMRTRIGQGESLADYYYKMLSLGRGGNMPDSAIITYIINGLYDETTKKILSAMHFSRCADLLRTLMTLQTDKRPTRFNVSTPSGEVPVQKQQNVVMGPKSNSSPGNGIVCFRCRERGHMARNCPKSTKSRVTDHINQVTAVEESVDATQSASINSIVSVRRRQELLKNITILCNPIVSCEALIDSGSEKSLVKRSIAQKCAVEKTRCNELLSGFAGGEWCCREMIKVEVKLDDVSYPVDLLIVEDHAISYDVLIGIDVLAQGTIIIEKGVCRVMQSDNVIHRPGESMRHVDAMSRAPIEENPIEADCGANIMSINVEDWVSTLQRADPKVKGIMEALVGNKQSDQRRQLEAEYCLRQHRLYRKAADKLLLVVPKGVRWRLLKLCHDDAGHPGVDGTIKRIVGNFWFPRMRNFAKGYVKSCLDCSYHREPQRKQCELYGMDIPMLPFQVLHMDHLGPFIKSKRGNEYILVIVDALSRYTMIVPVKSTKTRPVVDALTQLTLYFRLPQKIITDRGTAFTSALFAEFCILNHIQHIKVAVRTPRSNGLAERVNQAVLQFLKPGIVNQRDWDCELRMLQWTLNTKVNATTKKAAMDLIFDFPLRDLSGNKLLNAIHDDVHLNMNNRRHEVIANITKAREKWKERFDSKHTVPVKYNEGDLVLIEVPPVSTGESKKLQPAYRGQYEVKKVLRFDRYVLGDADGFHRNTRKFNTVAASDKMKPWCSLFPEIDDIYDDDNDNANL